MANSDYIQNGIGTFCSFVKLDKPLDHEDTVFTYAEFNFSQSSGVAVGMAGMIDDEIVRVESTGLLTFTVKRGCADTIPSTHLVGALCWLFDDSTGTDGKEYGAGDVIGVKPSPFTTGGGTYDIAQVAPDSVEFAFRFFRPYAPAQLRINGKRWHESTAVTEADPNARITWVHRDRILQADQLVGHDDPSIGPEPGVTYVMRVIDESGNVLRDEPGIIGQVFTYQWAQMVNDFGYPAAARAGSIQFLSQRDAVNSWQYYSAPFTVDPAGTLTSQYMGFVAGVLESPYRQNLVHAFDPAANYLIGVAARPSDRMSDACDLLIDGTVDSFARATYTPWLTSDFRLPELETTFNVRSSSLYDGVPVLHSNVGKLASIGQEIVQIAAIDGTVTIRRGCLDTVPQVHAPGARLWFFEQASNTGTTPYQPGEPLTCRFRPGVYGPMIPTEDLPAQEVYVGARSVRPYPPAQLVINGRPWFEEAAPLNGGPVAFSWARRNRITQGTDIYDHAQDDVEPEAGQVTRITFYYTTPATAPGGAAEIHVLRTVDVAGTSYSYTYDLALADGQAAGTATGTCGTVVINVTIQSLRDGALSYQGYHATLRLPSYPCAG